MQQLTKSDVVTLYREIPLERRNADTYEAIVRSLYETHLRPGDLCLDVGGNKGQHTFHMARTGATVCCFEALPELAQRLTSRSLEVEVAGRINIIPLAVSRGRGLMNFTRVVGAEALSSFIPQPSKYTHEEMPVMAVRLDDVISGIVRFIKLDIEGAEFDALVGARRILEESRPVVVFEFARESTAERFGYSASTFFEYFEEVGYDIGDIFGTAITTELWGKGLHLPWYAIAWPKEVAKDAMYQAIGNVAPDVGDILGHSAVRPKPTEEATDRLVKSQPVLPDRANRSARQERSTLSRKFRKLRRNPVRFLRDSKLSLRRFWD